MIVFVLAVVVRLTVWFNTAVEIDVPMSGLTAGYENDARTLMADDIGAFVRGPNPPSDANVLAHPPGYSIMLAAIFWTRDSLNVARVVHLLLSSFGAVLIFLIAAEFMSWGAAWCAGLLAALSPQLAYNSLLILPDSVSVLPILLGIWLLLRGARNGGWATLCACGALLGLSLWFRANTLLLPIFIAAAAAVLLPATRRWRSLVIVAAAFLMIVPLTIRNAAVFGHFIPVSLGSGVTMIEGIADYDTAGRYGLPRTDMRVIEMEAQTHDRPDYRNSLYNPDGVEREHERVARGLAVIRANPLWFIGVMFRRSTMMLRFERVPAIGPARPTVGSSNGFLGLAGTVLRRAQRPFITAIFLPLALIGLILAWRRSGQRGPVILLVAAVSYYLVVQSSLHTEYRYLLIIQYISLLFAAGTLSATWEWLRKRRIVAFGEGEKT